MKLSDLNQWDRETIEYDARREGKPRPDIAEFGACEFIRLRQAGYVIGPEGEVYKYDTHNMLRECANGIPCRHWCQGAASGKCTQLPIPDDGCPFGRLSHEEKRLLVAQKDAQANLGKEGLQQTGSLPLPEETRDHQATQEISAAGGKDPRHATARQPSEAVQTDD